MYFRLLLLVCIALVPYSVSAQDFDSLTEAYPDSLCRSCTSWNEPQEPFQVHNNTYYVGTYGLSSILITSPEGHILIDGALPNSAPLILKNIRTLGFDPGDIKLILNSHTHYDHAGGIAALQHASGARVAASPASAPVLERGIGGSNDPQYGLLLAFPAVANVERFTPGDTLQAGSLQIVSHATAGHAPGGTSWSWKSCEADTCIHVVYADSQTPVSADGFLYTTSETYPTALADYEQGFQALERMSCDILITTHPSASSLWERLEAAPDGLINPHACQEYAAKSRNQLTNRVNREKAEPSDQ